jgi:hypothetical protein
MEFVCFCVQNAEFRGFGYNVVIVITLRLHRQLLTPRSLADIRNNVCRRRQGLTISNLLYARGHSVFIPVDINVATAQRDWSACP